MILNNGQGQASMSCLWDRVTGAPRFSLNVARERDGKIFNGNNLSMTDFVRILNGLVEDDRQYDADYPERIAQIAWKAEREEKR